MRNLAAICLASASLLTAQVGCTDQAPIGDPELDADSKDDSPLDTPYPTGPAVAILEVYAMDIWGQWLAQEDLAVVHDGQNLPVGKKISRIALNKAGDYSILLTAPEFDLGALGFTFDGQKSLTAATFDEASPTFGLAISREMRDIPGRGPTPVFTVYMGIPHKWFASTGRPARTGNTLNLMMDGEEAFKNIAKDFRGAQESIKTAIWWWDSTFELERSADPTQTLEARKANTLMAVLEKSSAAKHILVNQFVSQDGILKSATIDTQLTDKAKAAGDNFEFLGQANTTSGKFQFTPNGVDWTARLKAVRTHTKDRAFDPSGTVRPLMVGREINLNRLPIAVELPLASWHQKFHIIDDAIAYIGGMNVRPTDWDTSEHKVFDVRRNKLDSSVADRQAVADKQKMPDQGPRKDYSLRITGPAVRDAKNIFANRWNYQIDKGAQYAANASELDGRNPLAGGGAGPLVQVTATMPGDFQENSIGESWIAAIRQANDFIFIEDQYFRMPAITGEIVAQMSFKPNLQLVVITKPVSEVADPGCYWTAVGHQELATQFPDRYHLYQLRTFDTRPVSAGTEGLFVDIDVHSKMLIIDDKWMSIGSANKNNRGIVYEGELNAAVFDATWVSAQRKRIVENMLGGPAQTDWISQMSRAAATNDGVSKKWDATSGKITGTSVPADLKPRGFIFPLSFRAPSECLVETVGPDLT